MPSAKFVSLTCPAGVPFRYLATADPATVKLAVDQNASDGAALRWLGYNSDASRRAQMRDVIAHFGWSTSHWANPVRASVSLRDYSVQSETGEHGATFETLVADTIRKLLNASAAGREVKPGVHKYENGFVFYEEHAVRAFKASTPPWDGVLVQGRTVWAFEVKASVKLSGKLRRQLCKRQAWIDRMAEAGYEVKPVAIVGTEYDFNAKVGVGAELRADGVWFGGLTDFDLDALAY